MVERLEYRVISGSAENWYYHRGFAAFNLVI